VPWTSLEPRTSPGCRIRAVAFQPLFTAPKRVAGTCPVGEDEEEADAEGKGEKKRHMAHSEIGLLARPRALIGTRSSELGFLDNLLLGRGAACHSIG